MMHRLKRHIQQACSLARFVDAITAWLQCDIRNDSGAGEKAAAGASRTLCPQHMLQLQNPGMTLSSLIQIPLEHINRNNCWYTKPRQDFVRASQLFGIQTGHFGKKQTLWTMYM